MMHISFASEVHGNALSELQRLQMEFPAFFRRALSGVGSALQKRIRIAMRAGGVGGARWPELSMVQQYQRLAVKQRGYHPGNRPNTGLKMQGYRLSEGQMGALGNVLGPFSALRGRNRRRTYTRSGNLKRRGQSIPDAFARWKSGPKRSPVAMGRLIGGIRYTLTKDGTGVVVGGLGRSMERYLSAVQEGAVLDGNGSAPVARGRQYITPRMRRMFWAAGIPLAADTRYLQHPERPLIRPLFDQSEAAIMAYIRMAVDNYAQGFGQRRDAMAMVTGLLPSWRRA